MSTTRDADSHSIQEDDHSQSERLSDTSYDDQTEFHSADWTESVSDGEGSSSYLTDDRSTRMDSSSIQMTT